MLGTANCEVKATCRATKGGEEGCGAAFGVLQSKWHIITLSARFWSVDTMACLMQSVVILSNMIVEERGDYQELNEEEVAFLQRSDINLVWAIRTARNQGNVIQPAEGSISSFAAVQVIIKDQQEYALTRRLIIEHLRNVVEEREEYLT